MCPHPLLGENCEASLYDWIAVTKAKQCLKATESQITKKDWAIKQLKKILWPDKSKFEIFGPISKVLWATKSWWKSCKPQHHTYRKPWRRLCYGDGCFANCKVGDLHQVISRLNQIGYHSILQHHVISSGTRQGIVFMLNNDPKHTCKFCWGYIKSKAHLEQLLQESWTELSSVYLQK